MTTQSRTDRQSPVLLQLHIPKTAGMTLSDAIQDVYRSAEWTEEEDERLMSGVYYTPAGIDERFVPGDDTRRILLRPDLRAVVGHFHFGLHEYIDRPSVYVTLLRDPVDRAVSLYYHMLTWDNERVREEIVAKGLTLEEFVRDVRFAEVDNGQTRRMTGADCPFGLCGRDLLERAKQNLVERFAVAGLVEQFGESLTLIKHQLAWPFLPVPVVKNVNSERPSRHELAPSALAAILEHNQLDVELYAFAKKRFEEAMASQGADFQRDCAVMKQAYVA